MYLAALVLRAQLGLGSGKVAPLFWHFLCLAIRRLASRICSCWGGVPWCKGQACSMLMTLHCYHHHHLAQGLQQLLDTMQSFCVTNGLTISIPKTEVVVFGGGHQPCQWHVGPHRLKHSKAFIYLGMLFDEDGHIKQPIQHRLARGYASQGSIFSRYTGLGCANSV